MPEETERYIRIPVSEGHGGHRIRTIEINEDEGIMALYCGECEEIITYLFSREKGWTMSKAEEWIEEHKKKAVSIKEMWRDHYTVGGYGIVWGGKDLLGDQFTPETDFWFDKITETPMVLYSHGEDGDGDGPPSRRVIGHVTKKVKDDIGLWIEAQIDRAAKYAEGIRELIEKGLLGWSSGAVSHLVERATDGKLISWPIAEFSLTVTPAEPRTLGVMQIKELADLEPAIKSFLPEAPCMELDVKDDQPVIRFHL